jgi:hypothetical protein
MKVTINLEKARVIAHDKRRQAREEEFAPYDAVIAKQIPGEFQQGAEQARRVIREKYALIQLEIDAADTVEQIKAALGV